MLLLRDSHGGKIDLGLKLFHEYCRRSVAVFAEVLLCFVMLRCAMLCFPLLRCFVLLCSVLCSAVLQFHVCGAVK